MAGQPEQPNHFFLTGRGTFLTYDTSGIDGRPHLTYTVGPDSYSFSGDEIRVQPTDIGDAVTVTLPTPPPYRVDLRTLTLTVLVPRIDLYEGLGDQSACQTFGVLTIARPPSGEPRPVKGQLQTYEYLPFHGTAKLVRF